MDLARARRAAHLRSRARRHGAGCRSGVLRRESRRPRSDAVRRRHLRVVAAERHPDGCAHCIAAAAMAGRDARASSRACGRAGVYRVALVPGAVAVRDQLQRGAHRRRLVEDLQRRSRAIRHPRRFGAFICAAVLAAPLFSSFADAAVVTWLHGDEYWTVWWRRFPSNVLTQLTVTPAIVGVVVGARAWFRSPPELAACRGRVALGHASSRAGGWPSVHRLDQAAYCPPSDRHRAGRAAATGPLGGAAVRPGRHESRAAGDNAGCRMGPRARESDCGADFGGPADPQRAYHPHHDRRDAPGTCHAHRRAPAIDACARRTVSVREAPVRVLPGVRPGAERKDERGVPRVRSGVSARSSTSNASACFRSWRTKPTSRWSRNGERQNMAFRHR